MLGRYRFFSSVPVLVLKPRFLRFQGTVSGTSVLVLSSRYHGLGTRLSGDYLHFSHFGFVWFHFGSILTLNRVEPEALVLEPKFTET